LSLNSSCRIHVDPGSRADPQKKNLLSAAKQVIHLTQHIGTELVGLQLTELTDTQKDELALLVAERCVVFFRDQDLDPRQQLDFTRYFGEVEVNPHHPRVPGLPGVSVVWRDYKDQVRGRNAEFRNPLGGCRWHSDAPHHKYAAGVMLLHNVISMSRFL
jgi:alpha-ketoglutarate-dependent taurine dioxygenase